MKGQSVSFTSAVTAQYGGTLTTGSDTITATYNGSAEFVDSSGSATLPEQAMFARWCRQRVPARHAEGVRHEAYPLRAPVRLK
jgi:hypothetical protein